MTPRLLRKVKDLLEAGATVVGAPPRTSPSLADYPDGDREVRRLSTEMWGEGAAPERSVGKGRLIRDTGQEPGVLYPHYDVTAALLAGMGVPPDFASDGPLRYAHRREGGTDLYFVGNREDAAVKATARFRVRGRTPEWWDPVTDERRDLPQYDEQDGITSILLTLAPFESGFVVFRKEAGQKPREGVYFPQVEILLTLDGPWAVSFDPAWGGPEKVVFPRLEDWSKRPEDGIRHYSGKAVYRTTFDAPSGTGRRYLAIGEVRNLASVRLNGKDLGIVWCAPWRLAIPEGTLRERGNDLEVTVANLWINRLIGDSALPEDRRLTKTTWNPYQPDSPLQPSGLLGPVTLETVR